MARVAADLHVPFDVQAALVDASGKVFWYWNEYRHFLRKAGVPEAAVQRLTPPGANKYEVMRQLLAELDAAGAAGHQVQLQLVRSMVALPLTAQNDIEPTEAKAALAQLRMVSDQHGLLPQTKAARERAEEQLAVKQRRKAAHDRVRARRDARTAREALLREFCTLLADTSTRQGRGYRLEEMFGELAALDGLRYAGPYRKGTVTQTDGMLTFESFQYLIEARWRDEPADVAAVAALSQKAYRSLQSTRGLFVSMAGFRPEVVDELERGTRNLLLMSGAELSLILEGRLTLSEAMQLKVAEGAKKGHIFFDLTKPAT